MILGRMWLCTLTGQRRQRQTDRPRQQQAGLRRRRQTDLRRRQTDRPRQQQAGLRRQQRRQSKR